MRRGPRGDSVGAAHGVAAELSEAAGAKLAHMADSAFVDALATTATCGAAAAIVGALVALAFLPARADREPRGAVHAVPEGAAA